MRFPFSEIVGIFSIAMVCVIALGITISLAPALSFTYEHDTGLISDVNEWHGAYCGKDITFASGNTIRLWCYKELDVVAPKKVCDIEHKGYNLISVNCK